ncbi:histidine phosphatase family protein [Companilactobacillus jidongensis]|uniref:histidine phosphatase family protein n=1 Tax=Companilactobacillus jidongensis TaxID=2486006 RepID=UPI000F796783|nr:histidine phosphatase family protein [Companilactobacillus jidongensis]
MKVYFVRHGLTMFNMLNKMQGWSDTPLTAEGVSVLKRTGEYLKNIHFDAIYSSDLKRAVDTANIIKRENLTSNADVSTIKNLREMCFGSFEGDKGSDVLDLMSKKYGQLIKNESDDAFSAIMVRGLLKESDPTGLAENVEDVAVRIDAVLKQLLNDNKSDSTILVVSHGAFLETLILKYFGENFDSRGAFPDNGSITITDLTDDDFRLEKFNLLPE